MTLHPDAQKVIDLIVEIGRPRFETVPVAEARAAYRNSREVLQPDPRPITEVRDIEMPGPGGPLALRLYRDGASAGRSPVLVYFHGGGWVIGDLDSHDGICREMAHRSGAAVVAVDYRLAPENPFPAAVDDCFAAVTWVAENARALGVDAGRISVGGDSAGGTLAVVTAMLAKEARAPELVSQVLVYPVTDLRMGHPSHGRLAEQPPIPRSTLQWFYDAYVPSRDEQTDWRVSPVLADEERLGGLPPTLLITAGYDPLGDEGLELGERIAALGGAVEDARFDGQIHGFLTMGRLNAETDVALDRIGAFIRKHSS